MSDDAPENAVPANDPPDPIDAAYVQAEAVLSDDAARAARRERVLAAVARETAAPGSTSRPRTARRHPNLRTGGWLAAACVVGLGLFITVRVYEPFVPASQPAPATHGQPAATPSVGRPPVPAPAQTPASNAERLSRGPMAPASALRVTSPPKLEAVPAEVPAPPSLGAGLQRDEGAAHQTARFAVPPPEAAPPPPPPPPPPPAPAASPSAVAELTVTAQRRAQSLQKVPLAVTVFTGKEREVAGIKTVEEIAPPPPTNAAGQPTTVSELVTVGRPSLDVKLRGAAAAGRARDVKDLLGKRVPVDAPDADGETALMKAIEADHPDVAALLLHHGASLDAKNQTGESARDMAAAKADPALNKALGLAP